MISCYRVDSVWLVLVAEANLAPPRLENIHFFLSFTMFFFPQSLLPSSQFHSSFANSFLLFKLFLKPDKGFLLSAPKNPSEPLPEPESGLCDDIDDQSIISKGDICAGTHLPDWSKSWPGRHCVVKYWVDCRVDVEHQAREIQKVEVDLRLTCVHYHVKK